MELPICEINIVFIYIVFSTARCCRRTSFLSRIHPPSTCCGTSMCDGICIPSRLLFFQRHLASPPPLGKQKVFLLIITASAQIIGYLLQPRVTLGQEIFLWKCSLMQKGAVVVVVVTCKEEPEFPNKSALRWDSAPSFRLSPWGGGNREMGKWI